MLFLSGRAFVLFRRMKGIQGWSSPPKRFDAKPSAFPVRRLCYLCAAPGRPTPKIPFESEEPVSYSLPSAANSRNRRPAAQIASVPFSHKTKFNFADRAGRGLPVPSAGSQDQTGPGDSQTAPGARLLFRAVRNFDFRASFWSRLADRPSAAPSGRLPGRAGVGSSGLTKSADAVWGTKRRGLWT